MSLQNTKNVMFSSKLSNKKQLSFKETLNYLSTFRVCMQKIFEIIGT